MECGGSTPPFQNSTPPRTPHGRRPRTVSPSPPVVARCRPATCAGNAAPLPLHYVFGFPRARCARLWSAVSNHRLAPLHLPSNSLCAQQPLVPPGTTPSDCGGAPPLCLATSELVVWHVLLACPSTANEPLPKISVENSVTTLQSQFPPRIPVLISEVDGTSLLLAIRTRRAKKRLDAHRRTR
jgi:hypothetical protein